MLTALSVIDLVLIATAYLLGSISCAILLCRHYGFADPREQGSGNPGATNVLRTTTKQLAIFTVIGDTLKGLIAVLIATHFTDSAFVISLTAFAAVLGHLYPVFFQFRGGKGVATTFGVCLGLNPLLGLGQMLCWLVVAVPFRISAVAALVTAMVTPAMCFWLSPEYVVVSIVMAILIIYRHRKNLSHLFTGKKTNLTL